MRKTTALRRRISEVLEAAESKRRRRRRRRGAIQLTFFSAQNQAQNLAQVIFGVLRHV